VGRRSQLLAPATGYRLLATGCLSIVVNVTNASVAEKLRLSQISPGLVQSEIRRHDRRVRPRRRSQLAQGVCDTEVPAPVIARAVEAIGQGLNIYTRLDGIAPLRQAIAGKLARHNGVTADPDAEILVTSGATAGFQAACMALFDPGDEVILFEPFYGYHLNTLGSLRVNATSSSIGRAQLGAGPGSSSRRHHAADAWHRPQLRRRTRAAKSSREPS